MQHPGELLLRVNSHRKKMKMNVEEMRLRFLIGQQGSPYPFRQEVISKNRGEEDDGNEKDESGYHRWGGNRA